MIQGGVFLNNIHIFCNAVWVLSSGLRKMYVCAYLNTRIWPQPVASYLTMAASEQCLNKSQDLSPNSEKRVRILDLCSHNSDFHLIKTI